MEKLQMRDESKGATIPPRREGEQDGGSYREGGATIPPRR